MPLAIIFGGGPSYDFSGHALMGMISRTPRCRTGAVRQVRPLSLSSLATCANSDMLASHPTHLTTIAFASTCMSLRCLLRDCFIPVHADDVKRAPQPGLGHWTVQGSGYHRISTFSMSGGCHRGTGSPGVVRGPPVSVDMVPDGILGSS